MIQPAVRTHEADSVQARVRADENPCPISLESMSTRWNIDEATADKLEEILHQSALTAKGRAVNLT